MLISSLTGDVFNFLFKPNWSKIPMDKREFYLI